jgi:hypothetical protein
VESIMGYDEVWSCKARETFDPTVGSRSNLYWSFRMPFSMEWMGNPYSVCGGLSRQAIVTV